MITTLMQFATTEAASGGIFEALGIDWKTLIIQIVAFVILVWLLGKYVYPWLMKSVDERQASIEAGAKAADEAKAKAEAAEKEVAKLMKEARMQASDILATAKEEATAAIEKAEGKAVQKAETIIANAHEQMNKDVLAAKKALRNETIDLVAAATEKIIGSTLTPKLDDKVIAKSIEEVR
jgi:F-type H+-transporting ATPase subunit b